MIYHARRNITNEYLRYIHNRILNATTKVKGKFLYSKRVFSFYMLRSIFF